jgi:type VI secretion system secreted protein VgrG
VPRIGQEVIVDFLEGDADRPLITGRVYNGEQQPDWHSHGLLSGFKSKTYRGSKYNELVFDDATDQERVRLNSENEKSQLNLGYLIHQNGNHRGSFRGTGFELRTDAYGAIRANEGLFLTSWGQIGASGDQLDLTPARQQIQSAWQLTDTLSQSAQDHNADGLQASAYLKQAGEDADDTYGTSEQLTDSDQSNAAGASDSGGRGEAARMKAPWLHLASPAGITMSTPESTHLAQGKSLSVATGEDVNIATGKSLVASISEALSLFVQKAGIKLFAAKGKVEVQAQGDAMELTAQKDLKITSTEGRVEINAANGILLASGGGYIRIEGGDVQVHGPGTIDVKGAQHTFAGPASLDVPMPELPEGACETQFASDDAASSGAGRL